MAKAKSDGYIWGQEISWHVCFLFRGNLTILAVI